MKKRKAGFTSDITQLEHIKKLVIIAMFSDDELMDHFVLKGGNALDLIYRISTRASVDVDLSIDGDLPGGREDFLRRLEKALRETFIGEGYRVFDINLEERPQDLSTEVADFWGGYNVEFKLIERTKYDQLSTDIDKLRKSAISLGQGNKFSIDISKHEYTTGKTARDFDGYRIFVYSPEMMVCEKLRAICQQMPEYGPVVRRSRPSGARARDFIDIHTIVDGLRIDMTAMENRKLLSTVFLAKRVPLSLLGKVKNYRDFHRGDFHAVRATVKAGVQVKEFDFYFDYVLRLIEQLEPLGDE